MQVAVYGGSFDPPHVGHAMVAGWLLWTGRADRVWLVPTYQHAFDKRSRPFADRLDLCRALAQDVCGDRIEVLDIEGRLPTPSYTLHTLRAIAAAHPEHHFRLVVGADVLTQTDHWHAWSTIQRDFQPIVVGRVGWPAVPDTPSFPGISSTEIRQRLASSLPVDHLVTAGVAAALAVGGTS